MRTRVQKWGNSPGLRLPREVLERAQIAIGDEVDVVVRRNQIVIAKSTQRKFDLAEMVSRMPENYRVPKDSFSKPVGKEW